jgi:hypothetical protein
MSLWKPAVPQIASAQWIAIRISSSWPPFVFAILRLSVRSSLLLLVHGELLFSNCFENVLGIGKDPSLLGQPKLWQEFKQNASAIENNRSTRRLFERGS